MQRTDDALPQLEPLQGIGDALALQPAVGAERRV